MRRLEMYIVMPMYNIIEYSDNYSKTWGHLWQYYRDDTNDPSFQEVNRLLALLFENSVIEKYAQNIIFQK